MYCHSSGECREGCKTDPDSCTEGECDPADHTCKEPAYCAEIRDRIQQYIDERISNDTVEYTGLIVGVDTPGCGISVLTTGLAVLDPETPIGPQHILPVASISKTFVAATVLQLVEEGRLSLNDTLSNWRTDIPNADTITIRHLLNLTAGVPGYDWGDCLDRYLQDPDYVWTTEELIDCISGMEPSFDPGTDWQLSNTNPILLGSVVESVTGNELHVEIRNRLLDPLGLNSTFSLWNEPTPDNLARSYEKGADGSWIDVTDKYNHSYNVACCNIASNAEDLLAWIRFLVSGAAISRESFRQMTACVDKGSQAVSTFDFWETGYGLGICCAHDRTAGDVIGHNASLEMAVSQLWHCPEWDSSVVILINHGYIGVTAVWPWSIGIVHDVFTILGEYR
jgi:D-alanyl-D-alanine carboxypeptidase